MGRTRLLVVTLGVPGLLLYGTLATAQWRGDAALSEFTRLRKEHPADSMKTEDPRITARKRASLALASRFIPDQSEPAYQTALQNLILAESESLHPSEPERLLGRGLDARVTALLRESLRSVNRAIALNPGDAEYHFVKATIHQNLQAGLSGPDAVMAGDAVTSLLALADRLDPHLPSLHFRLGSFWLALGSEEKARHHLALALVDRFRYGKAVLDLLLSSVGDIPELRRFAGSTALGHALLADFLWEHGFKDEAESEFRLAMAGGRPDYQTGMLLVQHAMRNGNYAVVREIISSLDKDNLHLKAFQRGHLAYLRGQSYDKEGRFQEAIDCLEDALRLRSDATYIHESLGRAYFKSGDYQRAIARYQSVLGRRSLDLKPAKLANLHVALADALEKSGEQLGALEHYLRALQIDPDNRAAQAGASALSGSPARK